MIPITPSELNSLKKPVQNFADCYLVSSIGALARSNDGQKILSENIKHSGDGFRVRFQNVDSDPRDYFISEKDILEHPIPFNPYYFKPNDIVSAIEIGMDRLLKKHPDKKPFISKLASFPFDERFEYNYPSNFMEMFTGKKPIALNERSLQMTLKKDKDQAVELLENIDKADDFSFVAGTGLFGKKGLTPTHCYTVEGVNSENQYLQIFDCREQESKKLSFDDAMKSIKFLTGYLRKG